jgi:hypothetical protein
MLTRWFLPVVLAIYADSSVFVFATAILQFGFGVGYSGSVCESAILLCLACYVTTKVRQLLFDIHRANADCFSYRLSVFFNK